MNREIEFRGLMLCTDNVKRWVYGYLVNNNTIKRKDVSLDVITETIGQYTGLKDKNGKKIFEGDIVKYDNDYIHQIGEIQWNSKNASFQIKGISSSSMTHLKRMIVIGNIYENDLESKGE